MKELENIMSIFKLKSYLFDKWLKGDEKTAEVIFYEKVYSHVFSREPKKVFNIELDDEDIEYFKNKYVLSELEYKEEELKETLDKVEQLRKQINYIKEGE
jgi:hypothetical protein